WLHQSAKNLALKCSRSDARRREREWKHFLAAHKPAPPDLLDELTVRELLLVIDDELERFPTNYRLPLILCCLEGHTQNEVARQLGWSPAAVKGRLERGRALLRRR